ncbi:cobyrinate a,c-diamide synthase [Candidatus Magnetomonas plexicatena]|uniref:cobyrinate a,c-diamide synthase n=1 Tax=Candidatus Magnetomonas plexicatena TaxID=2552947 RepID=UPI001C798BFE|nr:hydrogenobyrinic acid a,c-diamide synthase (glutamine-hydrolyzing) [Nitrospirales bacterium LBB_01]
MPVGRVAIAGLRGGSGKTTLSLGLLRLWRDIRNVVPFKKGPDYIDAGWLSQAANSQCYNLDTFIIPEDKILQSISKNSKDADFVLIEGNRGLFDGLDSKGTFSTASLAVLTDTPVILVVDCLKATTTVGVIVKGVVNFDSRVKIKGVVLNSVSNQRHESVIREAVETYSGVPVVGALKKTPTPLLPERHMGLVTADEHMQVERALTEISTLVKDSVDIEKVWEIGMGAGILNFPDLSETVYENREKVKIGVIKDTAFQFYYPENLDELIKAGAELIEISAVTQGDLPALDALYIGGGFPETNAIKLSENVQFKTQLKTAIENGLPVYAECGGLMFLSRSIAMNGKRYPMVGVFPMDFEMESKPQAHGYTVVETNRETTFFGKNVELRGHEFHYSRVSGLRDGEMSFAFKMKRGKGIFNGQDGVCYKNVIAAYTHLHALGAPEWVQGMITSAVRFKKAKGV